MITCVQWGIRVCSGTTGLPKDELLTIDIAEIEAGVGLNRWDKRNDFFIEKIFELGLIKRILWI
jgi:hypothetical protein